jgi:hypothetical protein
MMGQETPNQADAEKHSRPFWLIGMDRSAINIVLAGQSRSFPYGQVLPYQNRSATAQNKHCAVLVVFRAMANHFNFVSHPVQAKH